MQIPENYKPKGYLRDPDPNPGSETPEHLGATQHAVHPGTEIPIPKVTTQNVPIPLPPDPGYYELFPEVPDDVYKDHAARIDSWRERGIAFTISQHGTVYTGARKHSQASANWKRSVSKELVPTRNCKQEGCGNSAIVGGFVCKTHGGQLPNVRAAAQDRITNLADSAISTMTELLDKEIPPLVRRQAASDILDRAGLKSPDVVLELSQQTRVDDNPELDAAITAALRSRFPDMADYEFPNPGYPDPDSEEQEYIDSYEVTEGPGEAPEDNS